MTQNKSQTYTDKEISTCLLLALKHLKSELNLFTQEASNTPLYDDATPIYDAVSQLQRDVFNMMSEQGWYQMKPDTASSISKAYTKYANCRKTLSE